MLMHESKLSHLPIIALIGVAAVSYSTTSCGKRETATVVATRSIAKTDTTFFHADNDIAMTVRSLADALRVGEPLDSAEYDFEGVLTDGQGSPLYTDVQGAPGQWVIDVLNKKKVMIRNLYLGDLLPLDLRDYVLESLDANRGNELEFTAHEAVDEDDTDISVFECNGVYVRFEVRAGMAANGIEGPQMSIIMTSVRPKGAGKQIDALPPTLARP